MGAKYQLGILFVHGMGEQQHGDTLGEQGEAVIRWLQRRLENDPATRVRIGEVNLERSERSPAAGAEIQISFRPRDEDASPTGSSPRWLLSESWWADSFRPAASLQTLLWAVTAGPWLIAAQLDGVARRADALGISPPGPMPAAPDAATWKAVPRALTSLVLAVLAATVAAMIAPLALLLAVLAIVPIPFVQGAVAAAQRNLTGSYGDLCRLVTSDVQFGAMWSRVHADIVALSRECDRVAVVAHSQGTSISWQAIRRLAQMSAADAARNEIHRDRLTTFVTYGQALRKLKMLYLIRNRATLRERATFLAWSLVSTAGLVGLGAAAFLAWSSASGAQLDIDPVIGLAGIAGVLIWLAQMALGQQAAKWATLTQDQLGWEYAAVGDSLAGLQWIDYWASADPAPIGPLFSPPPLEASSATVPPAWQPAVPSYKVRNLGSTVLDHVVYWSNVAEFITAVIYDVTRGVARMPFSRQTLLGQLGSAIRQRHWRVGLLVFTRWIYFVTAGALFVVWFGSLMSIGSSIFDGVVDLFDLEVRARDYEWLRSGVGAALFGAGAAAGWYLLVKLWSLLVAADESQWFGDHSAPIGTGAVRTWLVALGIVGLACFGWLWTVEAVASLLYIGILGLGCVVLLVLSQGGQQRTETVEGAAAWPRWSWLTLAPPVLIGAMAFLSGWLLS